MANKKSLTHEQLMIRALSKLPNPLFDKKHRIMIHFIDNRSRSNESRFEHISLLRHELRPSDIRKIVSKINTSTLKRDLERKNSYNLYIVRNVNKQEYIKVSLELDFRKSNHAIVKTVFVTKTVK